MYATTLSLGCATPAQGFAIGVLPRSDRSIMRTLDRLGFFQIDSVNVLVRAHYTPAFSRLGCYDRSLIDQAAWGAAGKRRVFEYWAHEASLLPIASHPLLPWRMAEADRGDAGWTRLRPFARERRLDATALLARIRDEGSIAASELGRGQKGLWEWSEANRSSSSEPLTLAT